jgi:hypothetical protein
LAIYSPQLFLVFLTARLRAEIDFFLSLTEGFSKCSRFFTSERIPAFSQDFLNFLNADSKDSPSLILTNATKITFPSYVDIRTNVYNKEAWVEQVLGGAAARKI